MLTQFTIKSRTNKVKIRQYKSYTVSPFGQWLFSALRRNKKLSGGSTQLWCFPKDPRVVLLCQAARLDIVVVHWSFGILTIDFTTKNDQLRATQVQHKIQHFASLCSLFIIKDEKLRNWPRFGTQAIALFFSFSWLPLISFNTPLCKIRIKEEHRKSRPRSRRKPFLSSGTEDTPERTGMARTARCVPIGSSAAHWKWASSTSPLFYFVHVHSEKACPRNVWDASIFKGSVHRIERGNYHAGPHNVPVPAP